VLTREGVLINVSIHYWRGTKKLKPEDLGLQQEQVSDRLISLGHKRLLPKDSTAAIHPDGLSLGPDAERKAFDHSSMGVATGGDDPKHGHFRLLLPHYLQGSLLPALASPRACILR